MIDQEKLELLDGQFQRIFLLPVTRSSFREIQNAVMTAMDGNVDNTTDFLQALVTGDAAGANITDTEEQAFIKKYTIPTRIAREVHDRGEVLGLVTSDMGFQGNNVVFSCRQRRIDGTEFQFVTEMGGLLQIIEHFITRFDAAAQTDNGRSFLKRNKDRLVKLQELINKLAD